jgi:hypothetical protein
MVTKGMVKVKTMLVPRGFPRGVHNEDFKKEAGRMLSMSPVDHKVVTAPNNVREKTKEVINPSSCFFEWIELTPVKKIMTKEIIVPA